MSDIQVFKMFSIDYIKLIVKQSSILYYATRLWGQVLCIRDSSHYWIGFPSTGCGGIFQAPSGEIHSPNYPSPYRSNTECSWVIQVERHHRVLLNFTDFDLEAQDSCIVVSDTNFKHCLESKLGQNIAIWAYLVTIWVMDVFNIKSQETQLLAT